LKVKLLRRVFCFVLVIAAAFCLSTSAFAVKWVVQNQYHAPHITWTYVLNYSFHAPIQANIADGQNYWRDSRITNKPSFTQRTDATNVMFTIGSITHTSTSEPSWNNYFPLFSGMENSTYAVSRIVLTDGNILTDYDSDDFVSYAIIEYNPKETRFSGLTSIDYQCLVAHEIGHCMGLDHVSNGTVMKPVELGAAEINSHDATAYNNRYN